MEIFTKSLVFSSVKHQFQRRKNHADVPYINHPLQVAHILAQAGVTDYQVLSAAILHDTVEDTDTTPQQLQKEFGPRIKSIVLECTDNKALGKVQRKRYQIQKALKASNEAKLVKIADKISNNRGLLTETPKGWSIQRVRGYHLWSQAVFNNLRGVNQSLDKEAQAVFQKSAINQFSKEQKQAFLQEYYTSLEGVKH